MLSLCFDLLSTFYNQPTHLILEVMSLIDHSKKTPNLSQNHVDISPSKTHDSSKKNESASISESPQVKTKTRQSYDWAGTWTWETAGAILSVVGIGLLIGFLRYVDPSGNIPFHQTLSCRLFLLSQKLACLFQYHPVWASWNGTRVDRKVQNPCINFRC